MQANIQFIFGGMTLGAGIVLMYLARREGDDVSRAMSVMIFMLGLLMVAFSFMKGV